MLFDYKVGEAYFPRDRVPMQPLRASCDRRKEKGLRWLALNTYSMIKYVL